MSTEPSFDSYKWIDPTTSPAFLAVTAELSAMFEAQPDFRSSMLGLEATPASGASPTLAFDLSPSNEGLSDTVMQADVIMFKGRFDEDRGRFTARYTGLDTVGSLESAIQINGFMEGDTPVMTGVKSETYDRGLFPVPQTRRFVVYEADVEDGRVLNESTTIDPTTQGEIRVGMAKGRIYDLDSDGGLPLDVSRMDPSELAELRTAMNESDSGIVVVEAKLARTPYASSSLESFSIVDADLDYDRDSHLNRHLRSITETDPEEFQGKLRHVLADRDALKLFDAIGALPGSPPFLVSFEAKDLSIMDMGTLASIDLRLSTPEGAEEDVRPKSATVMYDVMPGQDPILSGVVVKADRFSEVGGVMVATHEITSSSKAGGKPVVHEDRVKGEVGLSAVGGRLYAFREETFRDGPIPKTGVLVSEVVDGLDGASLRDLLRTVTGKDEVHEWRASVMGEVGVGPVRVGGIDPSDAGLYDTFNAGRLDRIDSYVDEFRKAQGHDAGLMGQASRVVRSSSTPSEAKGPESAREAGLLDRMRSLLGGKAGR
jgi:hypothetical protein